MTDSPVSRRHFMNQSLAVAGPAMLTAALLPAAEPKPERAAAGLLKVVCVGGHPDDPESGCAGTLARYAEPGTR